jgi:hypothetical protein
MSDAPAFLDNETIIADALAQSGVAEPASLDFRDGLDRLVAAFNANPHMHGEGRAKARELIIDHLRARLQAERYWADHPEVQAQEIVAPVFVMGMPRTGSTLLVNLFECDPRWRTLLKWQVFDPVPPAGVDTLKTDPRCLARLEAERVAFGKANNPNIHVEWADAPTECVQLHMQDFKSQAWDAYAGNPDFSEYLMTTDMVPTYRWHRKMLQILQSRAPGRWLLKAPSHALYVDALLAVYPDAKLIWTHRDPHVAVPSHLSLIENVHRRYTDMPGLEWIAHFYTRQLAAHANRATAAQARHPGQVFDLYYDALMAEPMAAMEQAYGWLDTPLTDGARAVMTQWLADNPQGKFGGHSYSLDQYGIGEGEVQAQFAAYLANHWTRRHNHTEREKALG